jgi:tRNA threonylcarbamoyladenosine biosynthesis protein TsaB
MIVLGIDTSCGTCSAALYNGTLLAENIIVEIHKQAALTPSLIEKTLKDGNLQTNDIDVIAVTNGPGSFTGIRIGISLAQGFASVIGKPIIGISTLEAIALGVSGKVDAVIDAGKGEVYHQSFNNSLATSEVSLKPINEINEQKVIGVFNERKDYPFASKVAKAAFEKLLDKSFKIPPIKPVYIREPDAVVKLSESRRKS